MPGADDGGLAWLLLLSSRSRRYYVNNGDFQLALFKGSVPSVIIDAKDVYQVIRDEVKAGASKAKADRKVDLSDGKATYSQ